MVTSAVIKNPRSILDELFKAIAAGDTNFAENLAEFEAKSGVRVLDDIAAPLGGVPLFGGNCDGYALPTAPKTTLNAILDYTTALAGGSIDLNANVYYNSGYFTDIANVIRQDKYAKVGLFAKWTDATV